MTEKFGLKPSDIEKLKSVFKKYDQIEKVIVYGSRAKANFKPGSDIDLTVIAPSMNLSVLLKIENEIDDLLLPYKVDLSLHHLIDHPDLLDHIKRVGQIL